MPLTDLGFLRVGEDWPPKCERPRLDDYAQNRKLFEGHHQHVFKDSWVRLLRQTDQTSVEMVLNWPKRLSTLWADLLAGDPPTFSIGDPDGPDQQLLDEILDRNQFPTLIYDCGLDISRYGDAVMKIRLENGEAVIEGQSPAYWFPVVSISSLRDVKYHVLAWPFQVDETTGIVSRRPEGASRRKDNKVDLLKVEIHEKGAIYHRIFIIGHNKKIEGQIPVGEFFPGLPEQEPTGVDDFLVHQVPGLRPIDRLYGLNDYNDVETIVQEMEVRLAQIARVLDQHADPTMFGPDALIARNTRTGQEYAPTGGYIPIPDDNPITPGYLALPDTLAHAFAELEELKTQFYLVTETSPAAFGSIDVATATSGTALRRLMQAPLAKARRLRMRIDPIAKRMLELAMELESRGSPAGTIGQTRESDTATSSTSSGATSARTPNPARSY